jgi:hypothetical protein
MSPNWSKNSLNEITLIEADNSNNICQFCATSFKNKRYLKVHIDQQRCKGYLKEQNKTLYEIKDKLKVIEEQINLNNSNQIVNNNKINRNDLSTHTDNSVVNNINSHNTNNITLNVFGKENQSYIDVDEVVHLVTKRPKMALSKIAGMIYCDPEHPENHLVSLN